MLETEKKKDLVLIRVVAMISIVLNHTIYFYLPNVGHFLKEMIFNLGIPLFLVLSGYCYGIRKERITDYKKFTRTRFFKVLIPMYIAVIMKVLIDWFVSGKTYGLDTIVMYVLNLQGFVFLCNLTVPLILGPLWFMTVVVLCYCMLPVLYRLREKVKKESVYIGIAVLMLINLVICTLTGFRLILFILFIMGFFMASYRIRRIPVVTVVVVVLLNAIRIPLNMLELPLHIYEAYATFTFYILGVVLFVVLLYLYDKVEWLQRLSRTKVIQILDEYSMYVYMTHYMIIGVYSQQNIWVATIEFILGTVLLSMLLRSITKGISLLAGKLSTPGGKIG